MPATLTKILASLGLLILFAAIAFAGGYLLFYPSGYSPPATAEIAFADAPPAAELTANPARPLPSVSASDGLVLVDGAHRNLFRQSEISALLSKISDRGADVEYLGNFRAMEAKVRVPLFADKLRRADALLVVLPRDEYTAAEANLVERFVRKGGKLLLVSDPTRTHQINSLSERFGVNFQPDYLFNQHENDLNFQHIFVREFQPVELTSGVSSIALYTTGSIRSSGAAIAFTDDRTESSVTTSGAGLSPIAWGNSRNVLAVADFTFMIPPHNTALDNDQLLSNIADYVTAGSREFDLNDFPHFFGSGAGQDVDIVMGQTTLLGSGTAIKNGLSEYGIASALATAEDFSRDTVFLGLHEDALRVSGYLQAAGIRVDDTISGPFGDDLALKDNAVAVLDASGDRHILIILADTPATMAKAVEQILDDEFAPNLVSDFALVAAFPTKTSKK